MCCMSFKFSSLKKRMLVYSSLCLTIPVFGMVAMSYIYWQQKQEQDHYLLQQNALNFCLQDLENSIFYSRVSELSNLSIIRNELLRIYNIVDLSARYTHMDELKASESYTRSALIAPSPSPSSATIATEDLSTPSTTVENVKSEQGKTTQDANPVQALVKEAQDKKVTSSELEMNEAMQLDPDSPALILNDDQALKDILSKESSIIITSTTTDELRNSYINDLRATASLLDGTTGASIVTALDKARNDEFHESEKENLSDITIPLPVDPKNDPQEAHILSKENRDYYSPNQNYELANTSSFKTSPNYGLDGHANILTGDAISAKELPYPRPDADSIHELKTNYTLRFNEVINPKNFGNRYNTGFRTNFNQDESNKNYILGVNFKDLDNNRIKVFNHIALLNKLGFTSFSVNLKDPALDIFIRSRDRLLLSQLKNEGRDLNNILYRNDKAQKSFFVILKDYDPEDEFNYPNLQENKQHSRFISHVANSHFDTNSGLRYARNMLSNNQTAISPQSDSKDDSTTVHAGAVTPDVATNTARLEAREHQKSQAPSSSASVDTATSNQTVHPLEKGQSAASIASWQDSVTRQNKNKAQGSSLLIEEELDNSLIQRTKTYLAIIAPLSLSNDQFIVIITDISKLKQQEDTLKRLIANSLNEMVLSNSITQPINITLVDSELNPLAGSITTNNEVSSIVDRDLLKEARLKGTIQFYDSVSSQYISIGIFKHYNWFVIINSKNQRAIGDLYSFMALVGLAGLLFAMIAVLLVTRLTTRDASDISIIYNKIKHLATLIQDPILLQRICEGLPKREDEIGALSSHVRLMAKTVYQSIQEILQVNKARDIDEGERNIIEQWRHSAINRQVLLREYYYQYFNVYSEVVAINKACDFYDIFELKENRVAIFIGSVNESSIMASNNISLINIGLFRQMIRLSESIKLPLARAMQELNNNIAANNPKGIMTSACIVIIDRSSGEVEYFNAGHSLPILYSKDNGFDYIECRTAPLIGALSEQSFKSMYFTLHPGDSLMLYTDGVLTCTNHKDEPLGQIGFENMLHDETFMSPVETVNNLHAKLKRYTKDSKQNRDFTLLCYQYQKHQMPPEKFR